MQNKSDNFGLLDGLGLMGKFILVLVIATALVLNFNIEMGIALIISAILVFVPGLAKNLISGTFSVGTGILKGIFKIVGSIIEGLLSTLQRLGKPRKRH